MQISALLILDMVLGRPPLVPVFDLDVHGIEVGWFPLRSIGKANPPITEVVAASKSVLNKRKHETHTHTHHVLIWVLDINQLAGFLASLLGFGLLLPMHGKVLDLQKGRCEVPSFLISRD